MLGQKFHRLSSRVLEDVVSFNFSSQFEFYLSAIQIFCHRLTTQGNQKEKKVLWGEKGRRFGRCFSFYTLSPNEENAHTEFSFQPKTEFQIKSKLKITDISLNQGLGTAR